MDYLARVEGEGALYLKMRGEEVLDVRLEIFEPPRFFEALLQGRNFSEAPDITARICGICPVAYQMSAVHAMESALGVQITPEIRLLRRLLYCGEWIESHVLHIYLLHAPDFLRFEGVVDMAKKFRPEVERGLKLKKFGNEIVQLLGGREIHPINVRVGGFHHLPSQTQFQALLNNLKWGRDHAIQTIRWVSSFDFPELHRNIEMVSLSHPNEYPFNEGRVISNLGLNIEPSQFETSISESHLQHSHALHAHINERGSYLVGPMARFHLNYEKLPDLVKEVARSVDLSPKPAVNPFRSIIVRALEVLFAFHEAITIIERISFPTPSFVEVQPPQMEATGFAATEAPRGLLYHRYKIQPDGSIDSAQIIPPTSQNQSTIEEDLKEVASKNHHLTDDDLTHLCEQTIRNYDPCISCATHFLKLKRVQL